MYQVEVKNVSTNVMSSTFPASSNFSGEVLQVAQPLSKAETKKVRERVHTERRKIDTPRYLPQCTQEAHENPSEPPSAAATCQNLQHSINISSQTQKDQNVLDRCSRVQTLWINASD